jgi:hypothetical protein
MEAEAGAGGIALVVRRTPVGIATSPDRMTLLTVFARKWIDMPVFAKALRVHDD